MLRVDRYKLNLLPADMRAVVERELAELEGLRDDNPLQGLRKNPAQIPFFQSRTPHMGGVGGGEGAAVRGRIAVVIK